MRLCILVAALLALTATSVFGGAIYEVTATDGKDKITYRVKFGGGWKVGQWTAFDPDTRAFVYLTWEKGKKPDPVAAYWDHRTGETVYLYKFPGAVHPLPIIPSMKEMKVCPLTGDKEFASKRVGNYD
jgi:hypothetical protein